MYSPNYTAHCALLAQDCVLCRQYTVHPCNTTLCTHGESDSWFSHIHKTLQTISLEHSRTKHVGGQTIEALVKAFLPLSKLKQIFLLNVSLSKACRPRQGFHPISFSFYPELGRHGLQQWLRTLGWEVHLDALTAFLPWTALWPMLTQYIEWCSTTCKLLKYWYFPTYPKSSQEGVDSNRVIGGKKLPITHKYGGKLGIVWQEATNNIQVWGETT